MKVRDIKVFPALITYALQNIPERFDSSTGVRIKYDGQQGYRYHPTRSWGMWRVGEKILEVGVQHRGAPDFCGGLVMNSARVNVWSRNSRWDPNIGMSGYLYCSEPTNNKPRYWGMLDDAGLVDLKEVYPDVDWKEADLTGLGFLILAQHMVSVCYESGARGVIATDRVDGETETLITTMGARQYQPLPLFSMGVMCPWSLPDAVMKNDPEQGKNVQIWENHLRQMKDGRIPLILKDGEWEQSIGFEITSTPEFLNKNSGSQVVMYTAVADRWQRFFHEEYIECQHCSVSYGSDAYYDEHEGRYYCDECGNYSDFDDSVSKITITEGLLPPIGNEHFLRAAPAYYWRNG